MGKVIRPLAETRVDNYSIFPERMTLEECGEYHFHYRSVRIAFTPREFKDFMHLVDYKDVKKEKIFLNKVMTSKGDVIDKNRLVTEYTKNTYIKHRKDSAKEADFFEEKAYIHVHYRNLRLEFPISEFIQVARNFEDARLALPIDTLRDLFARIDDLAYVVIRNFENLPDSVEMGPHSDLDLLFASTVDRDKFLKRANAEKTFKENYRVQYKVPVGDSFILCDARVTGDSYFPLSLCADMVNTRTRHECFWVPAPKVHDIALAYHAFIHKKHLKPDYAKRVKYSKDEILTMFRCIPKPIDRSVGCYA